MFRPAGNRPCSGKKGRAVSISSPLKIPRHTVILLVVSSILLCDVASAKQEKAAVISQHLYLLAATLTVKRQPSGYPVTLYRIKDGKLNVVRELIPPGPHGDTAGEGSMAPTSICCVRVSSNAIYVLYPYYRSSAAEVVHFDDPALPDKVNFNPAQAFTNADQTLIVHPSDENESLLVPAITDFTDPARLKGFLTHIVTTAAGSQAIADSDAWTEYKALRWQGSVGGPGSETGPWGTGNDNNLVLTVLGHPIAIDVLPPALRSPNSSRPLNILAANQSYLIICETLAAPQLASPGVNTSRTIFVHDRARNEWKTVNIEGSSVSVRLFGYWMAAIVMSWNPKHHENPGRDNERSDATDTLPNIQAMYAAEAGKANEAIPGILILQNLADGRTIRIETRQEDSEILWAGVDSMLYRVNDQIYQARIVGDKLSDTTMIVKDDDVPEIHWVFWGK